MTVSLQDDICQADFTADSGCLGNSTNPIGCEDEPLGCPALDWSTFDQSELTKLVVIVFLNICDFLLAVILLGAGVVSPAEQ